MKPLTQWQEFAHRWSAGCGSPQCEMAQNIVLARGCIPCDILIVGEAPGESEDSIGIPFCGPAGQMLDYITDHSIPKEIKEWRPEVLQAQRWVGANTPFPQRRSARIAWTNTVCCVPRDLGGKKSGAPEEEQIECCANRLRQFILLCNPGFIIAVGTVARDWLDRKHTKASKLYWRHIDPQLNPPRCVPVCWIIHPAFIMRQNTANMMRMRKAAIITIADAVEEHLEGTKQEAPVTAPGK